MRIGAGAPENRRAHEYHGHERAESGRNHPRAFKELTTEHPEDKFCSTVELSNSKITGVAHRYKFTG
jgi:hypothetical protein